MSRASRDYFIVVVREGLPLVNLSAVQRIDGKVPGPINSEWLL